MFRWTIEGPARRALPFRQMGRRGCAIAAVVLLAAMHVFGQTPGATPAPPPATSTPAQSPNQTPAQTAPPPAAQQAVPVQPPTLSSPPVAIVPIDSGVPGAALSVDGPMQAWNGHAYMTSSGEITAGTTAAQVTLPYRGVLRVCPSTTVKLAVDTNAAANEIPGLQIAMAGGALEASFAIDRNSDVVLTPNFRIMIGGPGSSEVKVRLGQGGDTCVDNSGANAPYVVVTSVFDSGLYRVQPGQRVMFEHGDLHSVVDQEKESCGCPSSSQKGNEFPQAQSEGMAPPATQPPAATTTNQPAGGGSATTTLTYNAQGNQNPQPAVIPQPPAAPQTTPQAASAPATQPAQQTATKKKRGFFHRIGRFFKKVFGAE